MTIDNDTLRRIAALEWRMDEDRDGLRRYVFAPANWAAEAVDTPTAEVIASTPAIAREALAQKARADAAEARLAAIATAFRDWLDAPPSCYGVALDAVCDALGPEFAALRGKPRRAPAAFVMPDGLVRVPERVLAAMGLAEGGAVYFYRPDPEGPHQFLSQAQFSALWDEMTGGVALEDE